MSNFKISTTVPTDTNVRKLGNHLVTLGGLFRRTIPIIWNYILNTQVNTTYTLVLEDLGKLVILDNPSPITVIVGKNENTPFTIGSRIDFIQKGIGKVTFIGDTGVTIKSKLNNKSISAQNVAVSLIKEDLDTWYLIGDLTT